MNEKKEVEIIENKVPLISKHNFYFETALYDIIDYSKLENIQMLLTGDVDAFSSKNKTETTYQISSEWIEQFQTKQIVVNHNNRSIYNGFQLITLQCKRKDNDTLFFFLHNDQLDKKITKIGQMPSMADLQFSDIDRKYNKVLKKEYLEEFKKAIVSASHGYGVAAFIYLRRIFEGLIFEEFNNNIDDFDIDENDFISKRMEEKINLLKKYLPSQLVELKTIYGILSKGVHSLAESECLRYFSPLKLSIELILDQKIEVDLKKQRDDKVKKEILKINSSLGNKK